MHERTQQTDSLETLSGSKSTIMKYKLRMR